MTFLLQKTLVFSIPLLIVALAGVFAERSGIINIALDGIMIFGSFIGALTVYIFQENGILTDNRQLMFVIAMLAAAIAGALFSLLLSFSAIKLKADQTIGGTALNMLAPAIVLFAINVIAQQNVLGMAEGDSGSWFMLKKTDFGFDRTADLGFFGNTFLHRVYISTYICIALFIILSIILYKTKFGLRLRACGENPQAADSLGINVYKMRYIGTTISGALAGLGGFVYALTTANCSSTGDVAGFGFLAFAFGGNFDFLVVRGIHLGHVSTDSHARIAKQLHHDIDLDAVGFSPIYWFNLIFISHE